MSKEQLITIRDDGTIEGLQVKPGAGVDLREFGAATITRASDIKFDAERQLWFVEIATGKHRGLPLSFATAPDLLSVDIRTRPNDEEAQSEAADIGVRVVDFMSKHGADDDAFDRDPKGGFFFENYDDAVGFEIDFLNLMRERDPDCLVCH